MAVRDECPVVDNGDQTMTLQQYLSVLALAAAMVTPGFGFAEGVLDLATGRATVKPNPAFGAAPFTVECRVKLDRPIDYDDYAIIVSHETKASSTHWELYANPSDGTLVAYLTGCNPNHIATRTSITDGQWHTLAMTVEKDRVRLFVDGVLKADQAVILATQPGTPGVLEFFPRADGHPSRHGLMDEVRISMGVRSMDAPAGKAPEADQATLALWTFDRDENGSFADRSGHGFAAVHQRVVPRSLPVTPPASTAGPDPKRATRPLPGYLDRSLLSAIAPEVPGTDQLPLTVDMRVRFNSFGKLADGTAEYPVLTRGYFQHRGWGAFTAGVQEGRLFLRGNWLFPGTLPAEANVIPKPGQPAWEPRVETDARLELGTWHHLTFVIAKGSVNIRLDGKPVNWTVPVNICPERVFSGPWGFGSFATPDGRAPGNCDAWLGDIRIQRGEAGTDASNSTGPFPVDGNTLACWRFDQHSEGVVSSLGAHTAPLQIADGPLSPSGFRNRYPARPNPLGKEEDARDLDRIRGSLAKAQVEFGLKALSVADLAVRKAVLADWRAQVRPEGYFLWARGVPGRGDYKWPAEQIYDPQAVIDYTVDYDSTSIAIRRLRALAGALRGQIAPNAFDAYERDIAALERADATTRTGKDHAGAWMDWPQREPVYYLACALRRKLAFANPLLDFDQVLFLARGTYAGSRLSKWANGDLEGGHFSTQYFAPSTMPGGGLFAVANWKHDPVVRNILQDSVVTNGRLAGLKLDYGAFLSPSLSYDGKRILFAHSGSKENRHVWTPDTTWKVFQVNADGSGLTMLTDGPFNDFDACYLPGGRVVFLSERRGSYIRCFNPVVPSFCLHSMKADGSDIIPLSYYELNEWNPSVNNDGQLVYSRWDYTDRGFNYGATFWTCGPDGSNPRSPHGNYPYPWTVLPYPELQKYNQGGGMSTLAEMGIRAIPGSSKYVLTGGGHHGEHFGSLLILDLKTEDKGGMSQLKRLTPYSPTSELESPGRHQWQYGTPWPLSPDFFLCNSWEDIYLLDRFGNQELICERERLPCTIFSQLRLTHPIPLKPRPMPPVVPDLTNVGARRVAGRPGARIMIANVYATDIPLPKGVRIKYLRLVQNACKTFYPWGQPMVGLRDSTGQGDEHTPRIPLGIVPVEDDGSVQFYAPPGKMLMFQLLDGDYRAVHSMRSVTYVHQGELLSCFGCHENTLSAPAMPSATLLALRHPPATPQPELGRIEPVSYYRQIKPIVERSCLPCHAKENRGPQKMDYADLKDIFFQTGQRPSGSGSRTIPGYYGARICKMGQAVFRHRQEHLISETDYRQVSQWLDCNSLRLTAHCDEARQLAGELVWPQLDVDPNDPLGLEGSPGEMTPERTFADAARLHPARAREVFPNTAYRHTCAPDGYTPIGGPRAAKEEANPLKDLKSRNP